MKFEIESRNNGILFSLKTDSLKLTVETAVKSGANLRWANLFGVDLCGANLRGADLFGADGLENFPIQILGHKHSLQTTLDGHLQIGCHNKTFEQWETEAETVGIENNYTPLDVEIYKLHIAHIAKISRLLWKKDAK